MIFYTWPACIWLSQPHPNVWKKRKNSERGVNFINVLQARFFAQIFAPKNFKPKTELYNFWRQNLVQKCAHKMLIKLTLGVNFINVSSTSILAAFSSYMYVCRKRCQNRHSYKKFVHVDEIDSWTLSRWANTWSVYDGRSDKFRARGLT